MLRSQRINQLQEEVSSKVTVLRQKVDAIDGVLLATPASLRDAYSERTAKQLNEKLRMVESGLGRFDKRMGQRIQEKNDREYLMSGAAR